MNTQLVDAAIVIVCVSYIISVSTMLVIIFASDVRNRNKHGRGREQ